MNKFVIEGLKQPLMVLSYADAANLASILRMNEVDFKQYNTAVEDFLDLIRQGDYEAILKNVSGSNIFYNEYESIQIAISLNRGDILKLLLDNADWYSDAYYVINKFIGNCLYNKKLDMVKILFTHKQASLEAYHYYSSYVDHLSAALHGGSMECIEYLLQQDKRILKIHFEEALKYSNGKPEVTLDMFFKHKNKVKPNIKKLIGLASHYKYNKCFITFLENGVFTKSHYKELYYHIPMELRDYFGRFFKLNELVHG